MAQPKIEGVKHGQPRTIYGSDGSDWYAILVDADGHPQIDVVDLAGLQDALHSEGTDELDVIVEGFDPVPSFPICDTSADINVNTGSWTEISSYTVTESKNLYLTDCFVSEGSGAGGVEFIYVLLVGGATKVFGRVPAGSSLKDHLNTPLKATSEVVVSVEVYQFSGGTLPFRAALIGFEV